MDRREFLGSAILGAAWLGAAGCSAADEAPGPSGPAFKTGPDGAKRLAWRNWSGRLVDYPAQRATPRDETELASLLRDAPAPLRPVGAGHSFYPLVPTDGTLLSLRHFAGLLATEGLQATLGAGTRLGALGEPLHGAGLALANMPDIDEQTLAGSMATATHGTGPALTALHGAVNALRLVTPGGEVIDCSRDQHADIFEAARVSLGSLGVITRYTMDCQPSYRLRRRVWVEPFDDLLARAHELADAHRNFEFYYLPFCNYAAGISLDITDEPVKPRTEEPDNDTLADMRKLRDAMGWWPGARRFILDRIAASTPEEVHVDDWWKIYPSDRSVRFNEMEYHLPREALTEALQSVRRTIEDNNLPIFFPIEVRFVKSDDAWLSPFHGRESCSIAVHRWYAEDPLPFFAAIEPLYQKYAGRPHWGKMHTLGSAQLSQRYPRWNDFQAVRKRLDPEGRMLNPALRKIFGVT